MACLVRPANACSPWDTVRYWNGVWRIGADILIGLLILALLVQTDLTNQVALNLMDWADSVVSELQRLLRWMMGAPAGLKLNSQLDRFLGHFFLYHIYLWTGYLQFLRPVLGAVLWYISLSGCLGVSLQLAFVQDVLSMMTLHIYCFYVYAARLYGLQFSALASLWRLFRGKKWNVLRQRVDSAAYDVDQLFVGTLLFTVLLFLLPTTLLYYVIFTALRVLVLTLQGMLGWTVHLVNTCPVYVLLLRLIGSPRLADNVQFVVLEQESKPGPLFLSMQIGYSPFHLILKRFWSDNSSDTMEPDHVSWGELGGKLLSGNLIYPWIKRA